MNLFEWFHVHVVDSGPQLDITQTCLTLVFATVYSYVIAFTYRHTYQGEQYNPNFAHSVVLLGTLVSLVIAIIGNSIARAFGVFGALSIIRYRVPIRDPKDIVFVLASVVIGLACGVREYPEAGLATLFFVGLAELLHRFPLGLQPPPTPPAQPGIVMADDESKKHHKKHKHDEDDEV